MRITSSAVCLFMFVLACVPKGPEQGESDADTIGEVTLDTSSSGASQSGSSGPGSTTDVSTSGSLSTEGPVPTVTGDATEGDGVICPLDQAKLASLWSEKLALPPGDEVLLVRSVSAFDDGRLAIAGFTRTPTNQHAPGVFWVAADGAPIGWTHGEFEADELDVIGGRASGDSLVMIGPRGVAETSHPYASRFAADGQELTRVELKTKSLNWPLDFELRGDSAVVIGHDQPSFHVWLAEVDVATGAPAWEVMLPGIDAPLKRAVAIGPGGEIVAGQGGWPGLDNPEYKVWRVDDDGAVLWERDLFEPVAGGGELTELLITPDGQVVALATVFSPVPRITMTALALADGATTWATDLAIEDEVGVPVLQHGLVEPGALVFPIARGPDFWMEGGADPLTAALHRVSFAGAVLDTTPLPLADLSAGPGRLAATRGACGDLVVFQAQVKDSWLGSFAP